MSNSDGNFIKKNIYNLLLFNFIYFIYLKILVKILTLNQSIYIKGFKFFIPSIKKIDITSVL